LDSDARGARKLMVEMDVRGDFTPALKLFRNVERQIPFATAQAINSTLTGAQREIRGGLNRRFTLRRKQFIERTIKINRQDFATKTKLEGKLQVDRDRPVLAKHERGGRKQAKSGHLAIPTGTRHRRTKRFPTLKSRYGPFRRRGSRILGKDRTFIISSGASPGLFQRTGRGRRSKIKQLYAFKRSVPIEARLRFVETATHVVHRDYARNFHRALDQAIRTAKASGAIRYLPDAVGAISNAMSRAVGSEGG